MRRPADQAKLLFLYLLRSSSALATESKLGAASATGGGAAVSAAHHAAAAAASSSRSPPAALGGHISLRLARRSDVPSIQRCNLATLPENYSANFYANHMRQWPELALVAEHVPPGGGGGAAAAAAHPRGGGGRRVSPLMGSGYDPGAAGGGEGGGGECKIVAYVLGKVDGDVAVRDYPDDPFSPADSDSASASASVDPRNRVAPRGGSILPDDHESSLLDRLPRPLRPARTETLGHVTSLAVLPDYRRRGLAAQLMTQLHHHMRSSYGADAVGLHVRVSNGAATRLYGGGRGRGGDGGMGYRVASVIRGYYQDGEDAYFMRKELRGEEVEAHDGDANGGGGRDAYEEAGRVRRALDRFRIGARQPWEGSRSELRLPRNIPLAPLPSKAIPVAAEVTVVDEDEERRVVSGAV